MSWGNTAADIHKRSEEIEQRAREEGAQKQQREEREMEEAGGGGGGGELHTQQRIWKSVQELRGVTLKWTQIVEERQVHLNHYTGTRRCI